VTRVGIVGAVIIIVVASIFFGFRKAAREHANDDRPPATPSIPITPDGGSAVAPATR
jgi:hypothetical protein